MASARQFLGNGTASNKKIAEAFKNGAKTKILVAEVKETPGSKEPCIAVKCKGSELFIRVNSMSLNQLIPKFGDETDDWIGKDVTLTFVKQLVKGSEQVCLYIAPA